ncbi:MAG: ferritin-like domain-containing protein [Myxococcales bacterium]|nr:ferritin-like domain-containing protein [Myxococcales bacterium]MCB9712374.1 ferritin-like domain-containing protein [Myxococcales bacterium]
MRGSILGALGLAAACGPGVRIDDGSEDGSGSVDDGETLIPPTPTGDDGDSSTTEGPGPVVCEGSEPILQSGVEGTVPTGFERCPDGVIHRVEAVACLVPEPPGPECTLPDDGMQSCLSDADCTAGAFGRCIQQPLLFEDMDFCGCVYGCATDADCGDGRICACGSELGAADYPARSMCIPGDCIDDDACGNPMCALGSGDDGCGFSYGASCLTPDSACTVDADCGDFIDCFPRVDGGFGCQDFCCCGRPLLVDGRPVTAEARPRADWAEGPLARPSSLPAVVRARIAAHYTQAAQLEHASVASFARFTLELMALGAPPRLLEAAQRAGLDEIDHARRCFALASAYGGRSIGPGPLPVGGATMASELEAVVAAVIDEACIGETLAAVEARAALAHATEPAVRQTLEVIAADELRHAQLGWQTLRWALEVAAAPVRARLLERLERALADAERALPVAMVDHDRALLRPHGVLDPDDRRRALADAITTVLRPCAAALRQAWRSAPSEALATG